MNNFEPIVIAITGPESAGKSTLATSLSNHLSAFHVEEYAREYLKKTNGRYEISDLDKIADGQIKKITEAIDQNPLYIIVDTEMTVMKIWSEYKYQTVSPLILNHYHTQKIDFYLLCKPDLSWEKDPLRENENNRDELYDLYLDSLQEMNRKFTIISGEGQQRLETALTGVAHYLLTRA